MLLTLNRLFTLFYGCCCFFSIRQLHTTRKTTVFCFFNCREIWSKCQHNMPFQSFLNQQLVYPCCFLLFVCNYQTSRNSIMQQVNWISTNFISCSRKNIITVLFTLRPLATLCFWQDVKVQLLSLHSFQVAKGVFHSFLTKGVFDSSLHWDLYRAFKAVLLDIVLLLLLLEIP